MQQPQDPCDSQRILRFLDGLLSAGEQVLFEQHLDECKVCRSQLEQLAVEAEWWQKPTEFLTTDSFDQRIDGQASKTSLASPNEFPQKIASDGLRRVLELLESSGSKKSLGRLDDYEIVEPIGFGGMAVVLKGFESALDRFVAIKILAPHLASSTSARERFSREARAAAAVHHPNVIAIHCVSEFQGLPYLVMPYVRGGSLQDRLDADGPFDTTITVLVGKQIAAGLAAAHEQGIVHRDIKPANILLDPGYDRIVITDFGLARAADDASITQTGFLAGTPQYMSPEQARGDDVDHRSDLFSLGSLLYTLSSGTLPFTAENSYGVLRQITDGPALPLTAVQPDAPLWLENLVVQLHEINVADRHQSAANVSNLLAQCLVALQNSSERIPECLLPEPSAGGRRWVLLAATLVTVLLGFGYWQSRPDSSFSSSDTNAPTLSRANAPVTWPDDGEWVTFTGRFVMEGALPERRPEQPSRDKQIYSEPIVDESLIVNPNNHGIANLFVWLSRNDDEPWPKRQGSAKINQTPMVVRYEGGRLQPHVMILRVGQSLEIANRDPIQHFVDVGTGERLQIQSAESAFHTYQQPRNQPYKIACEYHPWFRSFALVTDHPHVAVTDSDGRFQIANVPSGTWSVHFWHELAGYVEQIVDERGLVQSWPLGQQEIAFDRPNLDFGELVPGLEAIPR